MSALSKELVFLILQFCNEEGFKQTAHMLESESGFYFDMRYFEEMMHSGNWHEAERYISGFTKLDDDRYSTKTYFEIRKQKFFETLDRKEHAKALDILMTDLRVFERGNEDLFKEMAQLLTFNDIRDHESLSLYGDTKSARETITREVKKLIEANPLFHGKLKFPTIKSQRLRRLINQSLNWQHILCEDPSPNPDIETLFLDHVCPKNKVSFVESIESNLNPSRAASSSVVTHSTSRSRSASTITQCGFPVEATCHDSPTELDSDISSKDFGGVDEVVSPIRDPGQIHNLVPTMHIDVPTMVALTLTEGSCPTSMDFHPVKQTFLLVGTSVGDVGLWDVAHGKKLLSRNFRVWDIAACSNAFKASLVKDPCVSVNQIMWSPDGSLFGVAYSKHIVQLYSYSGGDDIRQQLEIDAHLGSVNDLAFSSPYEQLFVITCGDDKTIKVWDMVTGNKQFTFDGHDTPVYSICCHTKENIDLLFSISVDGKIKAWLYDNIGARIDYDAPGLGRTRMAYSADGQRLFSCGTNKDGESFLVEWNDSEGWIRRMYQGLDSCHSSVVQFVTIKNQLLAAGDDHVIKFWDMDKKELLMTMDTGGELQVAPRINLNKECTLLAVVANENRIKILATDDGLHLLQTAEEQSVDASREISETLRKIGKPKDMEDVKSLIGEASAKEEIRNLSEFEKSSQCQSLKLSAHVKANEISRLTYTNSGNAILALASNAIHLLWKWPQNEFNPNSKATTKVHPQLWQPKSGLQLMCNDLTGSKPEQAVPCFALSKNDSYLLSASGGIISLFNMITFKTMITMIPPPPAATCLAFHPQDNNIVAIGMDNSTILIYNVRTNKVKAKLEGHAERVTGLAFSNTLNMLISSGADEQIFAWNADGWKMEKSRFLQVPLGKELEAESDTQIQIHQDQLHFLAIHKTHLAIYEVQDLECVEQWNISKASSPISHAAFSCDGQMVYAGFLDGSITIFDALVLKQQCRIHPSAYLPANISSTVCPVVIAAHPQKPTQFAVGLANGEIYVLEPPDPEGKWGFGPLVENQPENHQL
ncbi:topless-related protein 1 [Morus notabilis]|uniref:topless-related protein 1 n=1 Tax=Morus notabilis TaxID=981085 RepID=UPI000CED3854|nr:topless-related protein 1 [Morus notabilis]